MGLHKIQFASQHCNCHCGQVYESKCVRQHCQLLVEYIFHSACYLAQCQMPYKQHTLAPLRVLFLHDMMTMYGCVLKIS